MYYYKFMYKNIYLDTISCLFASRLKLKIQIYKYIFETNIYLKPSRPSIISTPSNI